VAFIDARTLSPGHQIEADVCVIGAGAAGLAIAKSFFGRSQRLVLLESGGHDPDPATQALYAGSSVGAPHAALALARLRYFGGTTNHWTAHVRPLDPLDFEERPWVPYSGWPFGRAELDPFYERAGRLLGLPDRPFDVERWQGQLPAARPWRFDVDRVTSGVRQIVAESHRRLGPRLREQIARSQNVDVYLFANALRIELEESRAAVARLQVGTLEGGRFSARARHIVLAAGGIENARILLLSSIGGPDDPEHGLVGRFYANHPEATVAELQLSDARLGTRFYGSRRHAHGRAVGSLCLSPEAQRVQQLRGCRISLYGRRAPATLPGLAVGGLASRSDALGSGETTKREPGPLLAVSVVAEPAPNPDSQLRLGDERDALGQRRVVLDWRIAASDSISVRRTLEVVACELGASGLGRARILFPEDGFAELDPTGSHHHMGTTRMHRDPNEGVVDANCRVHGISNLFVAGSSVFPTFGTANPTYTLLALAFRLSDHLQRLAA
jgi:choline dehydrogenase-like flavoprotein